jgi:hypothetical protein
VSTRADHVFEDPPKQISVSAGSEGSRVVLTGSRNASPDSLDSVQNPTQRAGAIAAHARWDPPDSTNILTWMALAASLESAPQILAARLSANPAEVVALRAEQDAARDDAERRKVCERQFELARRSPGSADLYYLSARCRPTEEERDRAFLEGWKQWPQNAWLANAAGYSLAERGAFHDALVGVNVALQNSPPLAEPAAIMIARLRRMIARSERAPIDELTKVSSRLAMLQRLETGQGVEDKPGLAYVKLAQGRLEEALTTAKGLPVENRTVRMVGASDGASPEHIRRALALPLEEGLDSSSIFLAMALAARNGLDLAPYSQRASKLAGSEALEMTRFMDALRSNKIASAQQMMNHMQFELQLNAYVCGSVLLGPKAPQEWRDRTKYLLFAAERPFLK